MTGSHRFLMCFGTRGRLTRRAAFYAGSLRADREFNKRLAKASNHGTTFFVLLVPATR
jgi:hypothetical protein